MMQSLRRLKARKRPTPAGAHVEKIEASFEQDVLTVTLPKKSAAQKPEKKIQVQAAA